jgi:Zn-dependent peptidase ImmA (M78 family)
MNKSEIVGVANTIKGAYGTKNPFRIAEMRGIDVIFKNYNPSVRGYYTKLFDKKCIFVNSNYDNVAQAIICAHELGHAILHTDIIEIKHYDDPDSTYEAEANIFAAALLLDQSRLNIKIESLTNYLIKGIFEDNMALSK